MREEAESEKMAHRKQKEKLEAELKQAREAAEKREDTGEGCSYQKRGRTGSEDSRHESTAISFFGPPYLTSQLAQSLTIGTLELNYLILYLMLAPLGTSPAPSI
jgi:hypothetical protein